MYSTMPAPEMSTVDRLARVDDALPAPLTATDALSLASLAACVVAGTGNLDPLVGDPSGEVGLERAGAGDRQRRRARSSIRIVVAAGALDRQVGTWMLAAPKPHVARDVAAVQFPEGEW